MLRSWGDRRIAIARELTKKFEEFFRGTVSEAAEHFAEGTRGELTLVVEGCREGDGSEVAEQDWQDELACLLQEPGLTVRQVTEEIVSRYRLPRRRSTRRRWRCGGRTSVRKKRIGGTCSLC